GKVGMPSTVPVELSSGPGAEMPMPASWRPSAPAVTSATSASNWAMMASGPPATLVGREARPSTCPYRTRPARTCVPPRSMPTVSGAALLGMDPGHARGEVRRAESERTHDDGLGARFPEQRHGMLADAAVGRQHDAVGGGFEHRCRFFESRRGPVVEADALDADFRAEQGQHADAVEIVAAGVNRRFELQDETGTAAKAFDPRQCRVDIGVFRVDADEIGAGFGELIDLGHEDRVGDHQMDVQ